MRLKFSVIVFWMVLLVSKVPNLSFELSVCLLEMDVLVLEGLVCALEL